MMTSNNHDNVKAIFREAIQKFHRGEEKYGVYDPAVDERDMIIETEEEILDAINYLAMFLMRIRTIKGE